MSSPVSLELSEKIATWRQRAAEGTLTLEEMKEAILYLRAGRVASATQSVAKRKKAAVDVPAAGDMLSELEGL